MGLTYAKKEVTKRKYDVYIALDGTDLNSISTTAGDIVVVATLIGQST